MNIKKRHLSQYKFLKNTIITGTAAVTAFAAGGEAVNASIIRLTEPVEHDNLLLKKVK